MTVKTTKPETTGKQQGTRYAKGRSGNPKGRPKGARHKTTVMLEKIMADDAKKIAKAVTEKAKDGDLAAAKLILDRVCPPRKDRPVTVDLPKIEGTKDLVSAMAKIIAATTKGEITPAEAQGVANLIDVKRKTLETDDIERRLAALEAERERKRS